ncbi:uncharacterized protein SOCG_01129 [Schizosaccharomyces octosporus yFS286]|uniref:Mug135-like C-terminal domain-containing protein n=1 Tax=Schizosaccharomyces octosporus (strain yFS286) TaxID=483514 RepID=S9RH50_SCHOY|nr:uncharacterized protein SOCG_01129 [Schizosaccharomyces octosporus yFS286]EPX73379.1 hypothetical protein SOCG_01129 [Schizosaccharomyces octosporus yFS286]
MTKFNILREDVRSLRKDVGSLGGRLERLEGQFESNAINVQANNGEIHTSIRRIDSKVNKTRTLAQRSENILHRVMASDTKPIPFVNGQQHPAGLPELITISDIDGLNPEQLKTYLEGYGGNYDENEPRVFQKKSFLITSVLLRPKNPVTSFQITMNLLKMQEISGSQGVALVNIDEVLRLGILIS